MRSSLRLARARVVLLERDVPSSPGRNRGARRVLPEDEPGYSYWSARRMFSRAALRAGRIAATKPTTIAARTNVTSDE